MRIQSNVNSNVGATIKGNRVLFPAESILELDDDKYKAFVAFIQIRVDAGKFKWLKKPELSEVAKAEVKAKALAEAKALVASEKESKPVTTEKANKAV